MYGMLDVSGSRLVVDGGGRGANVHTKNKQWGQMSTCKISTWGANIHTKISSRGGGQMSGSHFRLGGRCPFIFFFHWGGKCPGGKRPETCILQDILLVVRFHIQEVKVDFSTIFDKEYNF